MFTKTCALVVVSIVIASSASASAQTAIQKKVAKAIVVADEKWSVACMSHQLDKTLSFYADDAVLLAPNSPILSTKKAIRTAWTDMTAPTSAVSWKATKVVAARSGEMAYCYGSYDLSMMDASGKMIKDHGKFVEIWKKQADGSWKCAVDMFNSDLPTS
jgi:ketosteroid isomerase-like protein